MGGSGHVCLPTSSHLGQSGGEVTRLSMQENHSDCSGEAQQALVWGSNRHVQSDSTESAQPVNTALQSDPSQKSENSESPYMAPRATAIKDQGFSEAVAARMRLLKEDQSDQSMIQSGASLIRWASGHPLSSQLLTSLCTFFRTGSYNPLPLVVTGQPLLIN